MWTMIMQSQKKFFPVLFIFSILGCAIFLKACSQKEETVIRSGLDVLVEEEISILHGKHIGIITNPTAINRNGQHIVDLLANLSQFKIVALFGPEHGIRGDQNELIVNGKDEKTGLPVYSLYGETRKPTSEMLDGIDLLIFDIQDIGARFYTYISTMANAMEAAAENGIPFLVLDRPNPISGRIVEGPVLDLQFKSFVGIAPIPVRHGLTVGELAGMFNDQGWLGSGVQCDLSVIPVDGWKRQIWFDETGLSWIRPSPNMPNLAAATLYPGLCFLEATNVSEGRGTEAPFLQIGAPWIDGEKLLSVLEAQQIPAVRFSSVEFTPVDLVGRVMNPKYEGEACGGVKIEVTERDRFNAVHFGIHLVCVMRDLYPNHFQWRGNSTRWMELLSGTDWIPVAIENGESPDAIITQWQDELNAFLEIRQQYLIYK